MLPSLKLVSPADGIQDLLARLETKVVCIIQAESAAGILELLGSEAFERRLGGHGHEDGEINSPMRKSQDGSTGSSCLRHGCVSRW